MKLSPIYGAFLLQSQNKNHQPIGDTLCSFTYIDSKGDVGKCTVGYKKWAAVMPNGISYISLLTSTPNSI